MEAGRHLYGGARQVLTLMHGLQARSIRNTLVCPSDSAIAEPARQQGVTVQDMAMGGDFDVSFAWRLAGMLRRIRPDLVHVHSRRGADTFGGIAARMAGVPAVLSRRVDSLDLPGMGQVKYAPYRRIIAISSCIHEQLAALGVPETKLRLVRSAVAAACERAGEAAFDEEFSLPAEAFSIAVVAQLIPRKGHRYVLEAIAALRDAHPEIRVILFGRGPLHAKLARQVTALGLDEQVRLVGFCADLTRYIGHFKLLVHPAEREGLGISVLEAQAAGVPVVGFSAGGLLEAVADGETGLLVPPGDVPALTAAIRRLVEDEAQRVRLSAAGPAFVASRFGVDAMVEGNLAVYGELEKYSAD